MEDQRMSKSSWLLWLPVVVLLAGLTGCSLKPAPPVETATPKTSLRDAIVQAAHAQIGKPYVYGGGDPSRGFDCSGLVHWVFSGQGIELPRTAEEQIGAGQKVTPQELLPADLVFFDTGEIWESESSSKVHVGLFIGEETFIHAPSQGKRVRTDLLTNPFWSQRFTAARRVLVTP